jgi:hypothetical protein
MLGHLPYQTQRHSGILRTFGSGTDFCILCHDTTIKRLAKRHQAKQFEGCLQFFHLSGIQWLDMGQRTQKRAHLGSNELGVYHVLTQQWYVA